MDNQLHLNINIPVDASESMDYSMQSSLDSKQQFLLLNHLLNYFQDSQYNGTLSNILQLKSSTDNMMTDMDNSWILLSDILQFKKLSQYSAKDIITTIELHASTLFDLHPSIPQIRKTNLFNSADFTTNTILNSLAKSQSVHVSGFPSHTSRQEIKIYMSQYSEVENVEPLPNNTWNVIFSNATDLINVLSINHTYEDHPINVSIINNQLSIPDFGSLLGKKLTTSAGQIFTPGRMLQFKIKSLDFELNKLEIKKLFEKYSPVSLIDYEKEMSTGYIRFKKSVAETVVSLIQRCGGIFIQDEPINVRALQGNEDRLYWEVSNKKQVLNPTKKQEKSIVLNRKKSRILKKKQKKIVKVAASLEKKNSFGKRQMGDDLSGKKKRKLLEESLEELSEKLETCRA